MKHESNHKLNIACLECVKAHIKHKNELISLVQDFIRVLDEIEIQPNSALHHCAKNLLEKIKEDSE